jgi:dihydrolipoamide dehydrogenase
VIRIRTGKFPPSYWKSKDFWSTRWFCESNFDAKYGEWLGCHMIGAGVTDMIAEAIVARKLETTGHEIFIDSHPPTMSEAVMEAVADAASKHL